MPQPLYQFPFHRKDVLAKLVAARYPVERLDRSLELIRGKGEFGRLVKRAAAAHRPRRRAVVEMERCVRRFARLFRAPVTATATGPGNAALVSPAVAARFGDLGTAIKALREAIEELKNPIRWFERRCSVRYENVAAAVAFLKAALADLDAAQVATMVRDEPYAALDLGTLVLDLRGYLPSLSYREAAVLIGEAVVEGRALYPDAVSPDPNTRELALLNLLGTLKTASSRARAGGRNSPVAKSITKHLAAVGVQAASPGRPSRLRKSGRATPARSQKRR